MLRAQGFITDGGAQTQGQAEENRPGWQRPTVWILLLSCVWLGVKMPSPHQAPLASQKAQVAGVLGYSRLLIWVSGRACKRSTVGLTLQHEVQTLNSQTSPGGRVGQGGRHYDGGANPRLASVFLLLPDNLDSTAEKQHCRVWVSTWRGRVGRPAHW